MPGAGRLVLLATSHRVAPGLLNRAGWQLLDGAAPVLVGSPDHPLARLLADDGLPVEPLVGLPPSAVARELLVRAAAGTVVWLVADDGDVAVTEALAPALAAAAEAGDAPEVEVVHGSYDIPGARLLDLVAVMDRLRSPGGCPWDAEQSHASLVPYLLEEAYETVEAIETGDVDHLREELGDLLLQVVFHARLGEEDADRPWSVDDVAAGIVDKLVRRHPHVFADVDAPTAAHVEQNWERLKATEKERTSAVDGIPLGQPALALVAALVRRVDRAGAGVDVPDAELPSDVTADEVGVVLLGVAAAAQRRGIDPEAALRVAARELADGVRRAEQAGR
jgi:XTP/dITP diphosphohydrolase